MANRRKIYDNDGTTVEVSDTPKVEETVSVMRANEVAEEKEIEVSAQDALSSFAAYMIPQLSFMETGHGTCVICGADTNSEMRTICLDCMKKHKKELYDSMKDGLADTTIKIKV